MIKRIGELHEEKTNGVAVRSAVSLNPPGLYASSALRQSLSYSIRTHQSVDLIQQLTDDVLGQVMVAIDMKNPEGTLYLLGDMQSAGIEIFDTLVIHTRPTVLLLSPRVDYPNRQETQGSEQEASSQSYLPYQLDIRPSQELSYINAKNKLIALEISSEHEQRIRFLVPHNRIIDPEQMDNECLHFALQDGRLLHMSSSIDMENKVTIGCAGAVLTHLQRRRATISASSDGISAYFQDIIIALQIMESESHPSKVNQGPGRKSSASKEGLSVYGIFQRFAYSPQRRNQLKQFFLRPSTDIDVIRERHAFIGVYLRPDNNNPLNKLTKSLKHIKNLRHVMVNLRKGISTGSGKITGLKTTVWATLLAFAFYGIDIHDALKETAAGNELALLHKALRIFEAAQLYRVGRMIQDIVDIDSTEEQGRAVVKRGLDREIDELKDSYDGLSSLLQKVAVEIAGTISKSLGIGVNVIYFPQLGFKIAIPLNDGGEAAAYFKDFRMRKMDEKLEKEIEIVYELAQRVLQHEKVLLEASDNLLITHSLLAMAQAASFYRLTRPKLTRQNVINFKGGRRILQELKSLGGEPGAQAPGSLSKSHADFKTEHTPSMLLLTGPNYSSKSVYMKQVITKIPTEHSSFVPAESVEIGVTDKILVKSNSEDTVSQNEFGKGTNESGLLLQHGIGLICGILKHLLEVENAPKVIAATHFHEILENEFLKPGPRLILGHMEVQVSEECRSAQDQITYLYNFRLGWCDKSYGPICAALNGINETIVERANELASLAVRGENLTAACAMLSDEEMHTLEEADILARKFSSLELSSKESSGKVNDMLNMLVEETNGGGIA
ncbi:MutS family protein MSH5 [Aspergillus alliaceus]|uniref:MutS family protein MSH5 n=1 Tax=Petromyces alliaceus TaxID=209559 RepID=UPI0012A752E0|nr:DNA mismatch repair protein muts [Aspergillus alliaceus]KAB8227042.1 DNA mismatch repair protein muts [Aspergillus alliaceus]